MKLNFFVANLKLAARQRRIICLVPNTVLIQKILLLLIQQGYILSFTIISKHSIQVYLKYDNAGHPALRTLSKVSQLGDRVFIGHKQICRMSRLVNSMNVYQTAIISTSAGVLLHSEAFQKGLGGEFLLVIN